MGNPPPLVRMAMAPAPLEGSSERPAAPVAFLDSGSEVSPAMIVFLHPRATKPKNRRFPLAILAIAAVVEGKEDYAIVDGNVDPHPDRTLDRIMSETPADLLAVSVMPGPQMVAAIPLCREFRKK